MQYEIVVCLRGPCVSNSVYAENVNMFTFIKGAQRQIVWVLYLELEEGTVAPFS